MTQTNQTYIEEIKVKCANCMKETYVPTTHGTMVAIKKWVNEHKTRIGRTYCSIDFASIDFDSALSDAITYGEENGREERDKEIARHLENTVMQHVTPEMEDKKLAIKMLKNIIDILKRAKLTTSQEEG